MKRFALFPLPLFMLAMGVRTLVHAFDTGETWRVSFAATGTLIFAGLTVALLILPRDRSSPRRA